VPSTEPAPCGRSFRTSISSVYGAGPLRLDVRRMRVRGHQGKGQNMKLSESLLLLTKKVIRSAVGVGLDEAGARICGPTAWKYVKASLTPVVDDMEHRFPKLFLVPEEAERAVGALSADKVFEERLSESFANLTSGQQEILAVLAQQNETLSVIGKNVDDGFTRLSEKIDNMQAVTEYIATKLNELNINIDALVTHRGTDLPPFAPVMSPRELYNQSFTYQSDAQRWVGSGEADTASERLANARALVEAGLKRYPENTDLLVSLGYVEKTQAQAAQLQNDYEKYVSCLEKAAKCFAAVLSRDPSNIGALNGMANVYYYHRDIDRAIELGRLAVHNAPSYGAASWDLAISIEAKLEESGPTSALTDQLKATYRHLVVLIPQQPQVFTASDLAHVHKRLEALEH